MRQVIGDKESKSARGLVPACRLFTAKIVRHARAGIVPSEVQGKGHVKDTERERYFVWISVMLVLLASPSEL